ncbi:MAG: TrkH family potassium uptake protein, partial [Epsilonproteobacteria bacterium]|nr:TrkH family potassium uptake protein [Campylobacterota bacterium]
LYTQVDFSSAFFEAISGFTTTGATVYSDIESLPKLILFHRSLMHFLGGMGIIVLGVGLLSIINPTGSLSLFKAESTGISIEKITPKIKDMAISLWGIYLFLTFIDMLLLHIFGMSWFDAINHSFSTISTGGFSTKNDSLGHFASNPWIIWTTTFFMIISGINFLAHLRIFFKDFSGYKREEIYWYLIIFIVLSLFLTYEHFYLTKDSFFFSFTHSAFTIASILTTTGFATLDYSKWGHVAIAIVFIAMFIGGNAGSTAGGVKVIRYLILFKTIFAELRRIISPNILLSIFIDGKKVQNSIIAAVFGFFFLYILTLSATTLYLFARGYDALTSISAALAVVGNIGPGFGKVSPVDNFAFFSWYDKFILSFGMIVGRLECFTVFALFSRWFWKKF